MFSVQYQMLIPKEWESNLILFFLVHEIEAFSQQSSQNCMI